MQTVAQRSSVFAAPPSATARDYGEWHGIWVDVQDGSLVHYAQFADGGWQEGVLEVEFTCQHMLDLAPGKLGWEGG
jgi:hypothetical protein